MERVELFTNFQTKETRGCGYVAYSLKQAADDAIAALNSAYTFPGAHPGGACGHVVPAGSQAARQEGSQAASLALHAAPRAHRRYPTAGGSAPMLVRYEEAPPERKRKEREPEDPNEDRKQVGAPVACGGLPAAWAQPKPLPHSGAQPVHSPARDACCKPSSPLAHPCRAPTPLDPLPLPTAVPG